MIIIELNQHIFTMPAKKKLLDQIRDIFRVKHHSVKKGTPRLMLSLLYGSGLRLSECLRLRVKDIDFGYHQIVVRDSKGNKDRITVLPDNLIHPLKEHLKRIRLTHEKDKLEGFGEVDLPFAIARKYPNALKEWAWQYVFPASRRYRDPETGKEIRFHLHDSVLPRYIRMS